MRSAPLAIALAATGCATSGSAGGGSGDHLERLNYHHDLQPGWHLRSISVREVEGPPPRPCPSAIYRPIWVDLVFARADGSEPAPVSVFQCTSPSTNAPVAVHQREDGRFVVGARKRPAPGDLTTPPDPGAPAMAEARVIRKVAAEVPRMLRSTVGTGWRYAASVCSDREGLVVSARLASATRHHAELDARVLDALLQWRYEPARLSGRPVPSCSLATLKL
jgi:hypothetical protein